MYQPRTYRHWVTDEDLVSFHATVKETDLYIRAHNDLSRRAEELVVECRRDLETYIAANPDFLKSLTPVPIEESAPLIVRQMGRAAEAAGVGPMAAVAGAIAEFVGRGLGEHSDEIIVENGGDIYLKSLKPRTVGIYAGSSPLSGRVGLKIAATHTPLGVCTSSGTVGHSLSLGRADAVVALSPSTALADAAATAIANTVSNADDIAKALTTAEDMEGITGAVIIIGDRTGLWGRVEVCPMPR